MKRLPLFFIAVSFTIGIAGAASPQLSRSLKSLTLEEKARLVVGVPGNVPIVGHRVTGAAGFTYGISRMKIPSLNLADGPVGVRIDPRPADKDYSAFCTAFPSTTALAATWNPDMAFAEGRAMGDEARCYGVDVLLTPGINIMRNPLCGRNFEYYSEDPFLSGSMAAAMIRGVQNEGVGTSLKHFIANNQQINKLNNDSRISQRALREIYLKGFEICVKQAHPWSIMGSYNKIAGKYTQANSELLRTLLRDEWKYDGLVMTDWYKKRNTIDQLVGGTSLMMPGEQGQVDEIIAAVKSGTLPVKVLDEHVSRVLQLIEKSQSFRGWKYATPDLAGHARLSREAAHESMVLLKNDSSLLPLQPVSRVALFGVSAYQSIAGGGGSSNVNKPHIINISQGLESSGFTLDSTLCHLYGQYVGVQNTLLSKNPNAKDWERLSYNRVVASELDLSRADALVEREAKAADVAVIVIGRSSTEEADRRLKNDFDLSDIEKDMLVRVARHFHQAGKKVVVVLNACGALEIASWRQYPDAILMAWLPGQECGNAVADVLCGKAYPSGKLPMTLSMNYEDIPSSRNYPQLGLDHSGRNWDYTNYEEGIWVGYRYFDTKGAEVAYPFGFGLSYTRFAYSNPSVKRTSTGWQATVQVKNAGSRAGKEVVQLYVAAPQSGMEKPVRELRGFAKTRELMPGESQLLTINFSTYDLASFDAAHSQWLTEPGLYLAQFASSSRDIHGECPFSVKRAVKWKVADILSPVVPVNELKLK